MQNRPRSVEQCMQNIAVCVSCFLCAKDLTDIMLAQNLVQAKDDQVKKLDLTKTKMFQELKAKDSRMKELKKATSDLQVGF